MRRSDFKRPIHNFTWTSGLSFKNFINSLIIRLHIYRNLKLLMNMYNNTVVFMVIWKLILWLLIATGDIIILQNVDNGTLPTQSLFYYDCSAVFKCKIFQFITLGQGLFPRHGFPSGVLWISEFCVFRCLWKHPKLFERSRRKAIFLQRNLCCWVC